MLYISVTEQEHIVNSPPHKREALELLQLELASSPDSSKGASPYPGPSKAMLKKGLPTLLDNSPNVAVHKLTKKKNGRRLASPRWSPPKLKRHRNYRRASETVTSATAKNHRGEPTFLSPKHSSQSSDDSTDDALSLNVFKNQLKKMKLENAWDCRRRKRNEWKNKHSERTRKSKKKVYELDSEIEIKRKVVDRKRRNVLQSDIDADTGTSLKQIQVVKKQKKVDELCTEVKQTNRKKRKNISLDMESEMAKEADSLGGRHRKYKSNDRLSLAVTNMEKGNLSLKERGKQSRLSLKMPFPNVSVEKKGHYRKSKKSFETDRSQTTLMSWLKPVPKQSIMSVDKGEAKCSTNPTTQNDKKPIVIEWRGKQLVIKSPQVVLTRSKINKMVTLKPKNLDIDMNDRGSCEWNKDIDLLFNLETDVRITRKMIDHHETRSFAGDGKPRSRSTSPLIVGSKSEKNPAGNLECSFGKIQITEHSPRSTSKSLMQIKYTEMAATKTGLLSNTGLTIGDLEPTAEIVTKNVADSELLEKVEDKLSTVESVSDNVNRQCTVRQADSPAKNLRSRKTQDESSLSVDNTSVLETNSHSIADSGIVQFTTCQAHDSPANNPRPRNTREETSVTGDMVQQAVAPTTTILREFRNTSCKDNVNSKTSNHQHAKVSSVEADSPAKNLRLRIKQHEQKPASVISDTSNEELIEKENQHTPTMKRKRSFQFNVTVKEIVNQYVDESLEPENETPLIHVMESAEFGSVTLQNTYTELERQSSGHSTENNFERLKNSEPVLSLTNYLNDSPAKNLRKKVNNRSDHGSFTDLCSELDRSSTSAIIHPASEIDLIKSDQMDRLKKYRPNLNYAYSDCAADSQLENTPKVGDISRMKMKETEVVVSTSAKDTTRQSNDSEEMMQNSVVWHLEGTRQLDENPALSTSNPAGMLGGKSNDDTCENTCPIPQPIMNGEGRVNSTRQTTEKTSMSDVLGDELSELQDNFSATVPDYAISDELCNTAKGLSPSYFTKFRRTFSRSESLEKCSAPKTTVDNVIAKTTSLEQGVPQIKTKGNILHGIKNCAGVKLGTRHRPSKTSLPTPVHKHLSDKMLMTEYYAGSEAPEPKQKKGSDSVRVPDEEDTSNCPHRSQPVL